MELSGVTEIDSTYEINEKTEYKTSNFLNLSSEPIPTEMERDVKMPFETRVKLIGTDGAMSEYLVDHCIYVQGPSDIFREKVIEFWNHQKEYSKKVTLTGGIITLICLGATFIAGMTPGLIGGIVATTVAGIFTSIGAVGLLNAREQVALWNKPPSHHVTRQRLLGYENGFAYAFKNHLKLSPNSQDGVLHPLEVQYLYEKYFPSYCNNLLEKQESKEWIAEFSTLNPLNPSLIHYAYGSIPTYLNAMSEDYVRLNSIIQEIKNSFEKLRKETRSNTDQLIENLEKNKEQLLAPLKEKRDAKIALAEKELSLEAFKEAKKNIEEQFENTAKIRRESIAKQIQDVEEAFKESIESLGKKEEALIASYYPAAKELLQRALEGWENKLYLGINFDQYFTIPDTPAL